MDRKKIEELTRPPPELIITKISYESSNDKTRNPEEQTVTSQSPEQQKSVELVHKQKVTESDLDLPPQQLTSKSPVDHDAAPCMQDISSQTYYSYRDKNFVFGSQTHLDANVQTVDDISEIETKSGQNYEKLKNNEPEFNSKEEVIIQEPELKIGKFRIKPIYLSLGQEISAADADENASENEILTCDEDGIIINLDTKIIEVALEDISLNSPELQPREEIYGELNGSSDEQKLNSELQISSISKAEVNDDINENISEETIREENLQESCTEIDENVKQGIITNFDFENDKSPDGAEVTPVINLEYNNKQHEISEDDSKNINTDEKLSNEDKISLETLAADNTVENTVEERFDETIDSTSDQEINTKQENLISEDNKIEDEPIALDETSQAKISVDVFEGSTAKVETLAQDKLDVKDVALVEPNDDAEREAAGGVAELLWSPESLPLRRSDSLWLVKKRNRQLERCLEVHHLTPHTHRLPSTLVMHSRSDRQPLSGYRHFRKRQQRRVRFTPTLVSIPEDDESDECLINGPPFIESGWMGNETPCDYSTAHREYFRQEVTRPRHLAQPPAVLRTGYGYSENHPSFETTQRAHFRDPEQLYGEQHVKKVQEDKNKE